MTSGFTEEWLAEYQAKRARNGAPKASTPPPSPRPKPATVEAAPVRFGASWKAAWRTIGGKRSFFRSMWEANYARYLEWLKTRGVIAEWEHEPETFWFKAILRGTRSYLPDFRVTENDGSLKYHEVKGWMDQRSRTKIARMHKYYPEVNLVVIEKETYAVLRRQLASIVPEWESAAGCRQDGLHSFKTRRRA